MVKEQQEPRTVQEIDMPPKNSPGAPRLVKQTTHGGVLRRTVRGLGYAFALGCVVLATNARDARAELPHYEVQFDADPRFPAGCFAKQEFVALLDNQLHGLPLLEPPTSRVLRAFIGRSAKQGYVIDMKLEELDGTVADTVHYEFPADTCCFKVIFYAAFLASLHMRHGENAASAEPEPTPSPPPPSAPCPAPPPDAAPPRRAPDVPLPKAESWHLGISAGPIVAIGMTPEAVPGAQLGVAIRWPRLPLELDVDARFTPPAMSRPLWATTFEVSTFSGAVAACYRMHAFAACALASGGMLDAGAQDVAYPSPSRIGFWGFGARLGMQVPLVDDWLQVRMDGDLAGTVAPARIDAFNRPEFWETWSFTAVVGARLVVLLR